MDSILGLVGSIFSGGVTGLLGIIIQRFADYKNKQLELEMMERKDAQELRLRAEDRLTIQAEYAGKDMVAQTEARGAEAVADAGALAASFKMEPSTFTGDNKLSSKQRWVFVLLDAVRGLIRPGLTIYLCALTTYVWVQVAAKMNTLNLETAAALEVWKLVVATILYLTTTCVLWWFGTRNKGKQPGA